MAKAEHVNRAKAFLGKVQGTCPSACPGRAMAVRKEHELMARP
jgi:hypothetical protein